MPRRRSGEGGGCSLESVKLETSDAQLGVRAGGWEPSCGDALWGRLQDGGRGRRAGGFADSLRKSEGVASDL